ncbi:hypothetical protein BS47DRAFT_497098 [Hydnum rufescens UP504]|uniref:ATP-dependent DNA helicase n=1 Tax=Hydnum rufescens UP504 TaxID=1448309 RepID=A0A9P6B4J5_9AGAM|nr:hypothetical protein BS47DRAFT_497098 [Hydnum rufescens UP504]
MLPDGVAMDLGEVAREQRYPTLDIAGSPAHVFRRPPSGLIDCLQVLRTTFHKTRFRGKQKEIVEAAVRGCDVFVGAPTGMGKVFVVCPLLALMKDQVAKLRNLGITCASLTSETKPEEKIEIVKDLSTVYDAKHLNRLVVDEAHCISEWGHDFREEYRNLGYFRQNVRADIIANLKIGGQNLFSVVHPFNRENIFYEIRHLPCIDQVKQFELIYSYLRSLIERRGRPSTGIIYARTRATCDALAQFMRGKGLAARPYHRGIPRARLDKTFQEWSEGDGLCDVVCCTVAFGLGIDKGDVRYVIHYDLPKSFEGYYQETGRAGRDGEPAKCILYYSREDAVKARHLAKRTRDARLDRQTEIESSGPGPSSVEALIDFAENTDVCRHLICRYFGESIDYENEALVKAYCNKMCDVCKYPEKTKQRKKELPSDQWISTQLPRLHKEACALSDDEDLVSTSIKINESHHDNHRPILVPRNTHRSSTLEPRRPRISSPSAKSKGKAQSRDGYDRPVSLRGPIALPFRSGEEDCESPSIGVVCISRPAADELPSGSFKRAVDEYIAPTAKRPKILGNGSMGFGAPGRRISSTARFKPPLKASAPPISLPASSVATLEIRGVAPENANSPNGPRCHPDIGLSDVNDPAETLPSFDVDAGSDSIRLSEEVEEELYGRLELDASFSEKIPSAEREGMLRKFLQALRRALLEEKGGRLWTEVESRKLSDVERAKIVRGCAIRLEFNTMSYAVDSAGYAEKAQARLAAVKKLAADVTADGPECGEVFRYLKSACSRRK